MEGWNVTGPVKRKTTGSREAIIREGWGGRDFPSPATNLRFRRATVRKHADSR